MTLEELELEEPWVKEIFANAELTDRKASKFLYSLISDWTFVDGNPLARVSEDQYNIDKLNCFLKHIPDNSNIMLFLGMIRLTYMKRDLLKEWVPLLTRAYKILSERGVEEVDFEFQGLLSYIKKEV